MSLALDIEFLTGVCRAAREPGDEAVDWPPQPDRVFSALVSAWAARGERPDERAALEWLETQQPPTVHAGGHAPRTVADVFVPPNDPKASTNPDNYLKVMPDWRSSHSRQPRRFPTARLDDPRMALVWPVAPPSAVLDALNALCGCVGYLGHSASLVRCQFSTGAAPAGEHPAEPSRRRVYPGRLEELESAHRANPIRPRIRPGAPVFADVRQESAVSRNDWLTLEVFEGEVPDVRAVALVCRVLRHALMSGYRQAGLEDAIPEILSGHTPNGKPTKIPHLAIAPLAFAGFPHADGRVLGFALVPPHGKALEEIPGFRQAFEQVTDYDEKRQRRFLKLTGAPLRKPLRIGPAASDTAPRRSLSPEPYLQPARVWASATPIVLDRHLKRGDDAEMRELLAKACENGGLPRPAAAGISPSKHSAVEGMPPARPLAGEPPWMRWKTPNALASRQLVHAVIDFGEEVRGPVLVGAGRFTGLGLFRRLER